MKLSEAEIFERPQVWCEPFFSASQLMLSLPQIRLMVHLEHEASVGLGTKLIDVAGAGVVAI